MLSRETLAEMPNSVDISAKGSDIGSLKANSVPVNQYHHETVKICSEIHPRNLNLQFSSKGLHLCNLNIRHILPKLDELRLTTAINNGPDIFGLCETFLDGTVSDGQVYINGFDFLRKDRSETQNKSGGGLILYYKESLICKRRLELEISHIETLWCEFTLPNTKPFLVCTLYRPPSAQSEWINLFEEELSIAQSTGLEIILMGDFNIDCTSCINKKWQNLVQLFDLSQLVSEPTHITETTSTLIDHIYTTHQENITECFVAHYAISDHFPVCITRKVNKKISKKDHTTTTFRCFKHFDESAFLNDL